MQKKRDGANLSADISSSEWGWLRFDYLRRRLALTTSRALGAIAAVSAVITVMAILVYAPSGPSGRWSKSGPQ